MISYPEALQKILSAAKSRPLDLETMDLLAAEGRILAEELHSPEAVPSFDNSSMDGFAVKSSELRDGVNVLRVAQQIFAGDAPVKGHQGGSSNEPVAMQIMTGAPMPEGFDAVVKVEDTLSRKGAGGEPLVEIKGPVEKGQFVRKIGEDFQKGNLIAVPGTRVDSKLLMSAAAVGIKTTKVFKRPRVWVIATGKEVVEYSATELAPGEIRNSSSPYLVNELQKLGCEVFYRGIVRDEVEEFEDSVRTALAEQVDLIVSTGAVSMGVHDFIRDSVEKLGAVTNFHKVSIRPGKPVLFCEFSKQPKTVFVGLPGNPISTAVGLQFFLKPYLDQLLQVEAPPVFAKLVRSVKKPDGLRCFYKARWYTDQNGASLVDVLDGQASFMTHSLLKANVWVVLPEAGNELSVGCVTEVHFLRQ